MKTIWLKADWPAPETVFAGTTLRSGGFSQGVFSSLNPAQHVGDNPAHVEQNRLRIEKTLQLPAKPVWLQQTHSSQVIQADDTKGLNAADASFTCQQGVVCAVLTADCLPLLLCSRDGNAVAAVHAGWRGLLSGVVENTVHAMPDQNMIAWLGPAIGADCFEVGEEVRDAFIGKSAFFAEAFRKHKEDKWLADLYALARIILTESGVDRVYGGGFCTMTDNDRFFSYRRDGKTGRMATLIWKK